MALWSSERESEGEAHLNQRKSKGFKPLVRGPVRQKRDAFRKL